MFEQLPDSAEAVLAWSWQDYAPYAENLRSRKLTLESIVQWLSDWTTLFELLNESNNRLWLATTRDSNNADVQRRYSRFQTDVYAEWETLEQDLREKWHQSNLIVPGMERAFQRLEAAIKHHSAAGIILRIAERKFETQFARIQAARSVEWAGEMLSFSQLAKRTRTHPDRAIRERVWRLRAARELQDRDALNALWLKTYRIRTQQANAAGYDNFTAYMWAEYGREDYAPLDDLRFFDLVAQYIPPFLAKYHAHLAKIQHLDTLRPPDIEQQRQDEQAFDTPEDLIEKIGNCHIGSDCWSKSSRVKALN